MCIRRNLVGAYHKQKQPLDQIGNPSQTKKRDKDKMFLMEGLRNAEDVQNQEISDIVCLVQSGRAENRSVQHIFERGKICTGYFDS